MKKLYLLLIITLSISSINIQSSDQQTIAQQQLDIAKTAFATALLVTPLTGPIAQLFTTDFFEMIKAIILHIIQDFNKKFTTAEQAQPDVKPYANLLLKLDRAVSYSNDPVEISKNLHIEFGNEGQAFFNAITDAFTQSAGSITVRRDFKAALGEQNPLTKIAENSLWTYELQSTISVINTMSLAEKEVLFNKFQELSPDISDTGKKDFTEFIKDYVQPLVENVLVDSTLTVLLFNKGAQRGLTISLDELAAYIQENKENFANERAQLLENIKKTYTPDRPEIGSTTEGATAEELTQELTALLKNLSDNVDLTPMFQSLETKITSYVETFDKILNIAKESTNARQFQEKLADADWGTTDAGKFFTLLSAVQGDIVDYVQSNLNISIKRSFLRVDNSLSNYIKVIEAVNYAGNAAGDFGILDTLKNDVLNQITSDNDKYTFIFNILDQSTLDQTQSFITEKLAEKLPDLAKNYAADQGLSMIVLQELKSSYAKPEYTYNEVMQVVRELKQADPTIVDQMVKNMQKTFNSDATITNLSDFNKALTSLHIDISIPSTFITNAVKQVRAHEHIHEHIEENIPDDDLSALTKNVEQKASEIDATQQPQPTDTKPVESPDTSDISRDKGTSDDFTGPKENFEEI